MCIGFANKVSGGVTDYRYAVVILRMGQSEQPIPINLSVSSPSDLMSWNCSVTASTTQSALNTGRVRFEHHQVHNPGDLAENYLLNEHLGITCSVTINKPKKKQCHLPQRGTTRIALTMSSTPATATWTSMSTMIRSTMTLIVILTA